MTYSGAPPSAYTRVETQPGLDAFAGNTAGMQRLALEPLLAWARNGSLTPCTLGSSLHSFMLVHGAHTWPLAPTHDSNHVAFNGWACHVWILQGECHLAHVAVFTVVPRHQWPTTPLLCLGTGGLRALSNERRWSVLAATREILLQNAHEGGFKCAALTWVLYDLVFGGNTNTCCCFVLLPFMGVCSIVHGCVVNHSWVCGQSFMVVWSIIHGCMVNH